MFFCYIDEAGDSIGIPSAAAPVTPALVLAGMALERTQLHTFTLDFLNLKQRFFPALMAGCRPLGMILREIKGSEIRRTIRTGSRNQRRHAIGFLENVLALLKQYDAKIFARILIKKVGVPINDINLYTSYTQAICTCFHHYLKEQKSTGLVIADSRFPHQNEVVSHSVFTQKFKRSGDDHSRILEMPTFGHSTNHAGLQVVDIVASALLFPMAVHSYSRGHIVNVHVHNNFELLGERFGERLKDLQFRYEDGNGRMRGGITVSDEINHRSSGIMFRRIGGTA